MICEIKKREPRKVPVRIGWLWKDYGQPTLMLSMASKM